MAIKDWKKNYEKNRFEKDGDYVKVGGAIIGKGTKAERREYYVHAGDKIKYFKTKSQALSYAKQYMKRN